MKLKIPETPQLRERTERRALHRIGRTKYFSGRIPGNVCPRAGRDGTIPRDHRRARSIPHQPFVRNETVEACVRAIRKRASRTDGRRKNRAEGRQRNEGTLGKKSERQGIDWRGLGDGRTGTNISRNSFPRHWILTQCVIWSLSDLLEWFFEKEADLKS